MCCPWNVKHSGRIYACGRLSPHAAPAPSGWKRNRTSTGPVICARCIINSTSMCQSIFYHHYTMCSSQTAHPPRSSSLPYILVIPPRVIETTSKHVALLRVLLLSLQLLLAGCVLSLPSAISFFLFVFFCVCPRLLQHRADCSIFLTCFRGPGMVGKSGGFEMREENRRTKSTYSYRAGRMKIGSNYK